MQKHIRAESRSYKLNEAFCAFVNNPGTAVCSLVNPYTQIFSSHQSNSTKGFLKYHTEITLLPTFLHCGMNSLITVLMLKLYNPPFDPFQQFNISYRECTSGSVEFELLSLLLSPTESVGLTPLVLFTAGEL